MSRGDFWSPLFEGFSIQTSKSSKIIKETCKKEEAPLFRSFQSCWQLIDGVSGRGGGRVS